MAVLRETCSVFKSAGTAWLHDNASSMGAALAFYSAFAMAPLFLILSALAGLVFGAAQAREALLGQVSALMGPIGSVAVQHLLDQISRASSNVAATAIGVLLLLVGATSVMVELQQDLDIIWRAPVRKNQGWWPMLRSRAASLLLVLAFGFLLLLSLLVGTVLNAVIGRSPVFARHLLLHGLHLGATFVVFSLLFAMLFKWLPNVRLDWADVWRGACVTALLLTAGQLGIGYYLGHSTTTSAYAAAASLLVVLLWLYYAAQIFLFGAEFIWAYVQLHRPAGTHLPPAA